MLGAIFLALWSINLLMYLKLRSAIRNESSAFFNDIFGLNKSFPKSLSFMRVALNRGCWGEFESPETVKWLRLHWISAIAFIGYGMVVVLFHILSRI
jgi:hypothetical protein